MSTKENTAEINARELTDEEIYEIYDKKTKGFLADMELRDWLILISLADRGHVHLMKAIRYAYCLGVKHGRKVGAKNEK